MTSFEQHPAAIAALLKNNTTLIEDKLYLQLGDCHLLIRSNSSELIQHLRHYFAHVVSPDEPTDQQRQSAIEIIAVERAAVKLPIEFIDWKREPGKTGRKDSYYDADNARLIRKVKTGMVFLQSGQYRIAAGPCREYDNQVINFINAQYMNWLQNRGWLICHASGLVHKNNALGIAGFSGGGKSTLMLHLLEQQGISFLTNDRLFVKTVDNSPHAVGIPKLPRINPGTIVHNPRLHYLITEQKRNELLALEPHDLWDIEEKYDVMVNEAYGDGKICTEARIPNFLLLNWKRQNNDPLSVEKVSLSTRRDLLPAIMKSPGPFYQYEDGHFFQDTEQLQEQPYLDSFKDINVYEATGGVDFDALLNYCRDELLGD